MATIWTIDLILARPYVSTLKQFAALNTTNCLTDMAVPTIIKQRSPWPPPTQPDIAAPQAPFAPLHDSSLPEALLSQAHPNYEFRRGQLQMSEAVEKAW